MTGAVLLELFNGERPAGWRGGFLYVASPYSHPDAGKRAERYREANEFLRFAAQRSVPVHSPIVHWHVAASDPARPLPIDHVAWQVQNHAMVAASAGVLVLALPGWPKSEGVRDELRMAASLALPTALAWREGTIWRLEARDARDMLTDCYLTDRGLRQ